MKKLLIVLCAVLLCVSCEQKQRSFQTNSYVEKETTKKSVVDPFARIKSASLTQLNHMKNALNSGFHIKEMYVVKSRDFNNVYFAGALVNKKIAIWAIGGTKNSISLTYSINHHAYNASGLGMGSSLRDPITLDDDGCGLLMRYLTTK